MSRSYSEIEARNFSPFEPIKHVLAGAPGVETALGLLYDPDISQFELDITDASAVEAHYDHNRMTEAFGVHGIEYINTRKLLGETLAQKFDITALYPNRDALLNELKKRAELVIKTKASTRSVEQAHQELETLLDLDISSMDLDAALAINAVLANCVDIQGRAQEFNAEKPPICNFLYWRDTNHITGNKIGTHTMFRTIREQEVALTRMAFEALGLAYSDSTAQGVVNGERASIEGGDILMTEFNGQMLAMIGQLERTSWLGVQAWYELHEDLFSASGEGIIPVVVTGYGKKSQDQMHLDTYFSHPKPDTAVHCDEITQKREIHLLMRRAGEIVKVPMSDYTNNVFGDWIKDNATEHRITKQQQEKYVPNSLIHGNKTDRNAPTAFITRDDDGQLTDFLLTIGVLPINLDLQSLSKFYGGAHCATSEIR
jgi:arginine deiminase